MTDWENSVKYTFINISSELKQFILLRYQYLCHTHNLECVPYYLNNGIDYFENSYSKNNHHRTTTTTNTIDIFTTTEILISTETATITI